MSRLRLSGPGYTIPDECPRPDHRLHFRGSLSMAHTSQPNSGGSQFFLCFLPTSQLDGAYTVFGRIVSGFDVLAKIKRIDPEIPIHIEVLLPAFALGCVIRPPANAHRHARDAEEGHELAPDDETEQNVSTLVSGVFMLLVGLSMPRIE